MTDKAFIDTNVFIYLYSEDEIYKRDKSRFVLDKFDCITSTQVLNELSNVMIKKMHISPEDISNVIDEICERCSVKCIDTSTIKIALEFFGRYKYSIMTA